MLSALAAIPSGVSSFVSNRRRPLTWVAGTVGGVYLLSQWGMKKMGEVADKNRRDGIDQDNLAKRFNLNLQDCQFTITALLPTVSKQVLADMDVEACSAMLASKAAREREQSARVEQERELEEQAAQKLLLRTEEEVAVVEESLAPVDNDVTAASPPEDASAPNDDAATADPPTSATTENPHDDVVTAPSILAQEEEQAASVEVTEATASAEGQPAAPSDLEGDQATFSETSTGATTDAMSLSKSWAQVVATGDGQAEEVQAQPTSMPLEVVDDVVSEPPPPPEPTRAELWNQIKIFSFTRTITSLYVLTLLTLQTHVQLNLLGRASYVSSVVSTLPSTSTPGQLSATYDDDLELALYAEKAQLDAIGLSKDTERKYLTFSWWLLHRGWKVVGARVRSAVEEVIGPMGLKEPIVYGELSALLGRVRHKVEINADGSVFDFSSAIFPSTSADELETLRNGGIPLDSQPANLNPVTPALRRLLNETSDCLDSADCLLVRKLSLDRLFSHLCSALEGPFRPTRVEHAYDGGQGSRFEDVTERTARLASLLPTVARQTHLILNSLPNEYMEALEDVRELREFSAIIYSSFDKDDPRGSCCVP